MDEKRRERRIKDENEITVNIVSGGKNPLNEKFFYTYSKDISQSGARIQHHSFLPVDTPLQIEVALKNLHQIITTYGKVKWIRSLYADESFEAGVEFFNTPRDEIKKLADYISWKQNSNILYPV